MIIGQRTESNVLGHLLGAEEHAADLIIIDLGEIGSKMGSKDGIELSFIQTGGNGDHKSVTAVHCNPAWPFAA